MPLVNSLTGNSLRYAYCKYFTLSYTRQFYTRQEAHCQLLMGFMFSLSKTNYLQNHFLYREGRAYLKVRSNYIDLPGIILTLLVIPLRFAEVKSQWGLAAIGYLFNFLRLFKFSNVAR
jgi:hypothetical protein